jgi:hypothetical protein
MRIPCEISNPHYHPGPDFDMVVTKKRDLSVPPHWVANERITNPDTGQEFAIVMPPRDQELWEIRQAPHIHMPEFVEIEVNGQKIIAKVKVEKGVGPFEPKVHFDHIDAKENDITPLDTATL